MVEAITCVVVPIGNHDRVSNTCLKPSWGNLLVFWIWGASIRISMPCGYRFLVLASLLIHQRLVGTAASTTCVPTMQGAVHVLRRVVKFIAPDATKAHVWEMILNSDIVFTEVVLGITRKSWHGVKDDADIALRCIWNGRAADDLQHSDIGYVRYKGNSILNIQNNNTISTCSNHKVASTNLHQQTTRNDR